MEGEAAVAILASEGLAQVAVSCQHARRSFVPLMLLIVFVVALFYVTVDVDARMVDGF